MSRRKRGGSRRHGRSRARGDGVDIVPEFNTSCYLTINDQVKGDVRCYPLHRTGDAEKLLEEFVAVMGGGRIVTRPYQYEIFDRTEQYVGHAWGWKKTEV